jgi:hypothetical protein
MIGHRPYAAFGNSTGDRQMPEYTKAVEGARLSMIVLMAKFQLTAAEPLPTRNRRSPTTK